jgi:DNA polymerase elongation subunit (family B)
MYIGTHFDKKKNKVFITEYVNNRVIQQEYQPELFFYIEDERGRYESIHGKKLSRLDFRNYQEFSNAKRKYEANGKKTYESNVRPLFKTLEKHFKKKSKFKLRKTYFDIETGFCEKRGYAPTDDPFNPVTAITLYNTHDETLYSLVIPPKNMSVEEAEELLAEFPNNLVCPDEITMFTIFFELTKDTDVYLGWNSRFFDIPYMINRIGRIMGNEAIKNFCLWNYLPEKDKVEKYGQEVDVYNLIGKIHLDMLELYQKYTYTEQPSYSLDFIGELVTGERKVAYEGTLYELYEKDFYKFVLYARQDSLLLKKIDDKVDHVGLVFKIAHENLVDVKTVMGAVALSDNAIVLEAHRRNMIVPDKDRTKLDGKIPGAWVADPKKGITYKIGSVDLTSLYPSIFRTMNLGNETIFAQIEHTITGPIIEERLASGMEFAEAWHDIFMVHEVDEVLRKTETVLKLKFEDGEEFDMNAFEIYDFVFENNFIITAYGTIIRTDKQSVISSLLERWFNERKEFQKRSEMYEHLIKGIPLSPTLIDKLT